MTKISDKPNKKKASKKKVKPSPVRKNSKKCTIPGPVKLEALKEYTIKSKDNDAEGIIDYVEWQAPDEKVKHLEKVSTENIFGQPMDAWDVRTNKNRWWVITNPTNLYSQKNFPSLDWTISFHVGVVTRIQQSSITDQQLDMHDNINLLWNKIAHVQERFFHSNKIEDYQEIGMKCRECLLLLIQQILNPKMVPIGTEMPQKGNFIQWSEYIAQHIYSGGSKERMRAHLKDISKSTWQLVNWLTHSQSAEKSDAGIAINATENILEIFITAQANHESKNRISTEA